MVPNPVTGVLSQGQSRHWRARGEQQERCGWRSGSCPPEPAGAGDRQQSARSRERPGADALTAQRNAPHCHQGLWLQERGGGGAVIRPPRLWAAPLANQPLRQHFSPSPTHTTWCSGKRELSRRILNSYLTGTTVTFAPISALSTEPRIRPDPIPDVSGRLSSLSQNHISYMM